MQNFGQTLQNSCNPAFVTWGLDIGKTKFVMLQGLCGAFIIRVPFALLMQQIGNGSLFLIGMSIPCSTVLQIAMFFIAYFKIKSSNLQTDSNLIKN